jgi:hypothetical protein
MDGPSYEPTSNLANAAPANNPKSMSVDEQSYIRDRMLKDNEESPDQEFQPMDLSYDIRKESFFKSREAVMNLSADMNMENRHTA